MLITLISIISSSFLSYASDEPDDISMEVSKNYYWEQKDGNAVFVNIDAVTDFFAEYIEEYGFEYFQKLFMYSFAFGDQQKKADYLAKILANPNKKITRNIVLDTLSQHFRFEFDKLKEEAAAQHKQFTIQEQQAKLLKIFKVWLDSMEGNDTHSYASALTRFKELLDNQIEKILISISYNSIYQHFTVTLNGNHQAVESDQIENFVNMLYQPELFYEKSGVLNQKLSSFNTIKTPSLSVPDNYKKPIILINLKKMYEYLLPLFSAVGSASFRKALFDVDSKAAQEIQMKSQAALIDFELKQDISHEPNELDEFIKGLDVYLRYNFPSFAPQDTDERVCPEDEIESLHQSLHGSQSLLVSFFEKWQSKLGQHIKRKYSFMLNKFKENPYPFYILIRPNQEKQTISIQADEFFDEISMDYLPLLINRIHHWPVDDRAPISLVSIVEQIKLSAPSPLTGAVAAESECLTKSVSLELEGCLGYYNKLQLISNQNEAAKAAKAACRYTEINWTFLYELYRDYPFDHEKLSTYLMQYWVCRNCDPCFDNFKASITSTDTLATDTLAMYRMKSFSKCLNEPTQCFGKFHCQACDVYCPPTVLYSSDSNDQADKAKICKILSQFKYIGIKDSRFWIGDMSLLNIIPLEYNYLLAKEIMQIIRLYIKRNSVPNKLQKNQRLCTAAEDLLHSQPELFLSCKIEDAGLTSEPITREPITRTINDINWKTVSDVYLKHHFCAQHIAACLAKAYPKVPLSSVKDLSALEVSYLFYQYAIAENNDTSYAYCENPVEFIKVIIDKIKVEMLELTQTKTCSCHQSSCSMKNTLQNNQQQYDQLEVTMKNLGDSLFFITEKDAAQWKSSIFHLKNGQLIQTTLEKTAETLEKVIASLQLKTVTSNDSTVPLHSFDGVQPKRKEGVEELNKGIGVL